MFRTKSRFVGVLLILLLTLALVGAVSAQEGATFTTNPFTAQSREAVNQPASIVNGVTFSSTSMLNESHSRATYGLTHSINNSTIAAGNSIACNDRINGVDAYTLENSYYRTFKLSSFGITKPLSIHAIEAGIELARPANGIATQPVNVNLYVLRNPTPSINNLTPIGSARYDFPFVQNQFALMPVSALVFPEETLVVEINIPRALGDGQFFYIGSNAGGETAPGFIRAPACGVNDMTTPAALIPPRPTMHMLINVMGQTSDANAFNVLTNSDFEIDINGDGIPDNWKGKNLTKDKLKADKPHKKLAYNGQWAFKFKGLPGEASKIVQKVDLTSYPTQVNDTMHFAAAFNAKNLPPGAVVKLKITYRNAAIPKDKLTFGVPTGTYDYQVLGTPPEKLKGEIEKVKLIIQNKATSGKFFVDTTSTVWTAVVTRSIRDTTFGGSEPVINYSQTLPTLSGGAEVEAMPLPQVGQ